ncbi:MAG TPA: hypothetical protein V6D33_12505 [Cyanophyceae cyanobacterium]
MATDTRQLLETIKGAGDVLITNLETGDPLHITGVRATVDLGIETRVQEGPNPLSEMVTMGSFITARRGMFNLVFTHLRVEVMEFIFGVRFEKSTVIRRFPKRGTVPPSARVAPIGTGIMGFGMAADQEDSKVSIVENGYSRPLIRVPYAANPTTPLGDYEFMQGANLELVFGQKLRGKTYTFKGSAPFVDAWDSGEEPLPPYSVDIMMTTSTNRQVQISADNITIDPAGNSFDPAAAEFPIKARVDQELGQCAPIHVTWLGAKVAC